MYSMGVASAIPCNVNMSPYETAPISLSTPPSSTKTGLPLMPAATPPISSITGPLASRRINVPDGSSTRASTLTGICSTV